MDSEIKEKWKKAVSLAETKKEFKQYWWVYLLVICLLFSVWAYKHDMAVCEKCLEDPCGYCGIYPNSQEHSNPLWQSLNISNLTIKKEDT